MKPENILIDVNGTVKLADFGIVARSLQALLAAPGFQVRTFGSAEECLSALDPASCGCLITDLLMSGMNGLELQEKVNQFCNCLPVIVLTGHADVKVAVASLENGAVTLIEKPFDPQRLLSAVRKAMLLSQTKARRQARLQSISERLQRLSTKEQRVMELIVSGETNKSIATQLSIGIRTIDRQRKSILEKMEVEAVIELALMLGELSASTSDLLPIEMICSRSLPPDVNPIS